MASSFSLPLSLHLTCLFLSLHVDVFVTIAVWKELGMPSRSDECLWTLKFSLDYDHDSPTEKQRACREDYVACLQHRPW